MDETDEMGRDKVKWEFCFKVYLKWALDVALEQRYFAY